MKIHDTFPKNKILIEAKQRFSAKKPSRLTIVEATHEQVIAYVKQLLKKKKLSYFNDEYRTSITISKFKNGKFVVGKSVSVIGISPYRVIKLIESSLTK